VTVAPEHRGIGIPGLERQLGDVIRVETAGHCGLEDPDKRVTWLIPETLGQRTS
jgi:hypothetical protein